MRSSTPDSCIVEASSKETGWASSRASAAIAWAATPSSESPSCHEPSPRDQALAQSAEPRAEQLQRSLDRGREHRRECDAEEVEGGGERLRVEVPDGDEALLAGHDERISLVGVELDRELPIDELEGVARSAVDLRHAPERQRVLEEARSIGLPQRALREQRMHALDASRRFPAYGRATATSLCSAPTLARKRLEVERRSEIAPVEERARVGDRERRLTGRERVADEECYGLSGLELELSQGAIGEVGVLCEIRLTDGSERAHERRLAGVERVGDCLRDLRADALVSGREPVGEAKQRRSDSVIGCRRTEARRGGRKSQTG